MLAVQKYLKTKTLDDLTSELGIVVKKHDSWPLVILNYDQIESPKTNEIVRECRGLILNSYNFELVARSFPRFFNWGEVADEMKLFDFSNFIVDSKEDGSLVVIYWSEDCRAWMANTRGSFADDNMQSQSFTWKEGFLRALGLKSFAECEDWLDRSYTYVGEFCSPWNKIVRRYDSPRIYLLTMFRGMDELTWEETKEQSVRLIRNLDTGKPGFVLPTRYEFKSIEEVQDFLKKQAADDATFEGVVIRDCNNRRYKIKSPTYLGLHKLRGEGDNLFNPKHLLPFVMAGEDDELLTYFSEVKEQYYKLKSQVQKDYIDMIELWADNKHIENQKDFALAISNKTPYTSVLFNVKKKHGLGQKSSHVKEEWRNSEAQIFKRIKL